MPFSSSIQEQPQLGQRRSQSLAVSSPVFEGSLLQSVNVFIERNLPRSSATLHAKGAHCSLANEICLKCWIFFFSSVGLHFRLQSVHRQARQRSGLMCRTTFFLLSCLGSNCSAACPSSKQADGETFKWLPFFSLRTHLTHDTSVSFTPGSSRPHYIFLSVRLCGPLCALPPQPFHLLPARACKKKEKKIEGSGCRKKMPSLWLNLKKKKIYLSLRSS